MSAAQSLTWSVARALAPKAPSEEKNAVARRASMADWWLVTNEAQEHIAVGWLVALLVFLGFASGSPWGSSSEREGKEYKS